MEIIKSNKGRDKICVDGYVYTKHKPVSSGTRWRCVRRAAGCKGALICKAEVNRLSVPHDHPPNRSDVNVAKARNKMKQLAMSTTEKPAAIVARATSSLTPYEKATLRSEQVLKRSIRAQRSSVYPPQPASLSELVIDGEWALTQGPNQQRFLIYDSGTQAANRMIVLAAPSGLKLLSDSTTWHMDGTFDAAPKLFKQVYVILAPIGNTAVPVVYAFMTSKTQEAYEELFQAVVDECSAHDMIPSPDVVITDFEKGAMNGVKAVLGDSVHTRGCFFSFVSEYLVQDPGEGPDNEIQRGRRVSPLHWDDRRIGISSYQ